MSINQAENTVEDRLVNRIAALEQDLRDIKTKQRIGGDNTVVAQSGYANAVSSGPLAAGAKVYFNITLTPNSGRLTLWDFAFTLYIDGTGFDINNVFSDGTNLTAAMKNIRYGWRLDWRTSYDPTGIRRWHIWVENYDSSAHVIGMECATYAITTASGVA